MTMNMTGNHETYLINDVEIRSQHLFVSISDKHKLLGSFTHNRLRLVYAGKKVSPMTICSFSAKQALFSVFFSSPLFKHYFVKK